MMTKTAKQIGEEIGRAIARDVKADGLPTEWTGLDPQDVDQIPDSVDRDEVEAAAKAAYEEAMEDDAETLVCGHQIQIDRSGVGHAWRNIDAEDIPANIREEIEGEIIDGGKDECSDYVASNGLHYRWS